MGKNGEEHGLLFAADEDFSLKERLDDKTIGFMTGLFERIQSSSGKSLGDLLALQTAWYDELNLHCDLNDLTHDQSGSDAHTSELIRAMQVRNLLEPSCLILQKLSSCVASQLEACRSRIRSLKASAVFVALPDEILYPILEYAAFQPMERKPVSHWQARDARCQPIIKTVTAAVTLSSLSSRLRRVVLNSPKLWNRVCTGMPPEMIETCISRVGISGLHVYVDNWISSMARLEPREEMIRHFLESVAPCVGMWRSFEYNCSPDHRTLPVAELFKLELALSGVRAPQLSELSVRYADFDGDVSFQVSPSMLHFYSTWDIPGLRSMSTLNFIPREFHRCTTLVSLSIEMVYDEHGPAFDLAGLSAFLSCCPVLSKLSLRFRDAEQLKEFEGGHRVVMTNVKELELDLSGCSSTIVEKLTAAVRFPCVTSMKFTSIGICSQYFDFPKYYTNNIINSVFPGPRHFPLLERLHIISSCRLDPRPHDFDSRPGQLVCIPIHNIPSLTSLSLDLTDVILEPLVENCMIPLLLSTLHIGDCDESVWPWLEGLRTHLAAQGRSNSLRVHISKPFPGAGDVEVLGAEEMNNPMGNAN